MTALRPYQAEAVSAVYRHLEQRNDNPVLVLPTGAGKSWCIAQLVADTVDRWHGRILVLAHRRELLEQNADKIRRLCPQVRVGLYSAGLKRRDTDTPVVVAGIQSVYKRACELDAFDLVLVDEAHLIPADGEGMYRQFLADACIVNPQLRVIGLTATPYRLDSGEICSPDHFLNHVCFEVGIRELIRDGYLCPLVSKAAAAKVDTSDLHVRGGEFVAEEAEQLMDQEALVEAACREILTLTQERQSVLIFTAGVQHGRHVQKALQEVSEAECGFVCGETPVRERDALLARFRGDSHESLFPSPPLRYLANANLLTVGFDAPRVDCVVLLRPTMSPGLLVQMCGRGFRLHPDKSDCLILDFAGNIERHGPIDQIRPQAKRAGETGEAPAKECPECHSLIATGYAVCPDCGHAFPLPERPRHEARATDAGVLSGEVTVTEYEVRDITYSVHRKRKSADDAPRTMRVEYRLGLDYWVSEWVCVEHTGYARRKAEQWWRRRSPDPVPDTAEGAVAIAEAGGVAVPDWVTVRRVAGDPFDRIVDCRLGPMPDPVPAGREVDLEDVPF
ncbi:DEAD/DEAH box helicase family protein [Maioricimonas sp. JC845]|uniref:DEAD/DEAH box helicase n=1 Tax=Maioricimonas sp. JC845 TaxID=3232138 RepID=UPI0034574273